MTKGKSFFSIRKLLQLIGIGFIFFGLFFLWAGLLKIYTYYAFIPGGKFHFEGFGVGSFMFAYITVLVKISSPNIFCSPIIDHFNNQYLLKKILF